MECCGSIAYIVEGGKKTSKINIFASINGSDIERVTINLKPKDSQQEKNS